MNLITITKNQINDKLIQTVSARELHTFLQSSERFSAWFERQLAYGFVENIDYLGCEVFNTLAKQTLQDYCISINMAKEISMIQRTDKGTAQYKEKLNHDIFNEWVKNSPYKIYVSSYKSDLNCVLEMSHRVILSQNKNNTVIEKLFCNQVECKQDFKLTED